MPSWPVESMAHLEVATLQLATYALLRTADTEATVRSSGSLPHPIMERVHLGGVLRWDQRDEHHAALGLDAGAPADRRRHHLVTLFGNCSDGFQKCVVASRRGVASAIYTVP
jgi:hypothetical protein